MNAGRPKENANPTIRSVDKDRFHARRRTTPLDWSHMGHFQKAPIEVAATNESSSSLLNWIPTTSEDRAILQALMDVSKSTHGKGVTLLQTAGLSIPTQDDGVAALFGFPEISLLPENTNPSSSTTHPATNALSSYHNNRRPVRHEAIDAEEVFQIIRTIQDPEHPHTLEQLGVVSLEQVQVYDGEYSTISRHQDNEDGGDHDDNKNNSNNDDDDDNDENAMFQQEEPSSVSHVPSTKMTSPSSTLSTVHVRFTPTIPHCSMATLIGLCLRVKLIRSLPSRFKISVQIEPGTHASENAINKQLRDKERVCAALENKHLAGVVNTCIKNGAGYGAAA